MRVKRRTGSNSLVATMRKTLQDHYPDQSLALGGTSIVQKGKFKIHIMVNTGLSTNHHWLALTFACIDCTLCSWFFIDSQESSLPAPFTPMRKSTNGCNSLRWMHHSSASQCWYPETPWVRVSMTWGFNPSNILFRKENTCEIRVCVLKCNTKENSNS